MGEQPIAEVRGGNSSSTLRAMVRIEGVPPHHDGVQQVPGRR
jgi:hypothetical protein